MNLLSIIPAFVCFKRLLVLTEHLLYPPKDLVPVPSSLTASEMSFSPPALIAAFSLTIAFLTFSCLPSLFYPPLVCARPVCMFSRCCWNPHQRRNSWAVCRAPPCSPPSPALSVHTFSSPSVVAPAESCPALLVYCSTPFFDLSHSP